MSSEDWPDRDQQVDELLRSQTDEGTVAGNGHAPDVDPTTADLVERVERLEAKLDRVDELESQLDELKRLVTRDINHIKDQLRDGDTTPDFPNLTKAERYIKKIPADDREDVLGPSERRAIAIFEEWWELARKTDNGYIVSTHRNSARKYNPAEFKISLQDKLGEDLAWEQVYRAMKMLAKMTGGEYHQDEYGREHVVGGAFEYHERTTPDNTDDQTYKVLQLSDENSLTLL